MKNVLVIIPTYNEAQNIEQVVGDVQRVAAHLRAYDVSLLIVDDNSPDGTGQRVKALQKQFANIFLLSGPKNGLGRAYVRGFQYALQHIEFAICIMMDADLSHNPADIPALLKAINHGADYVIGSRYAAGGAIPGTWPLIRIINSRIANIVARKLVGLTETVTDLTGGFKAIRRDALEKVDLTELNVRGYIFQVSLLHAFMRRGYKVQEVPITFKNRQFGTSKLKLRDILEFLYRAYKLNPNAPIQRIVRFGIVGACGSVVNLAVLTVFVKFFHAEVLLSAAIAIEVSILFNFFLNHYYTFKGYGAYPLRTRKESTQAMMRKIGKFNIGALGGAAISFTTFSLLFKFMHLNYLLADIVAIGVAMSWNYYISTHFVWKVVDETV